MLELLLKINLKSRAEEIVLMKITILNFKTKN